jgi:formylmethanofuran dehydrogenase subunit E
MHILCDRCHIPFNGDDELMNDPGEVICENCKQDSWINL